MALKCAPLILSLSSHIEDGGEKREGGRDRLHRPALEHLHILAKELTALRAQFWL